MQKIGRIISLVVAGTAIAIGSLLCADAITDHRRVDAETSQYLNRTYLPDKSGVFPAKAWPRQRNSKVQGSTVYNPIESQSIAAGSGSVSCSSFPFHDPNDIHRPCIDHASTTTSHRHPTFDGGSNRVRRHQQKNLLSSAPGFLRGFGGYQTPIGICQVPASLPSVANQWQR